MRDKAALERFLDWREIDRASCEIVLDQSVLDEALTRCRFETPTKIDISIFSDEELSAAVEPHLLAEPSYLVWWAFDRSAVRMSGADVTAAIAKLWFPSSDDVVVYDATMRPILLLDHEELLCLP